MAHLKRFGVENFRVFEKETWFDFAPITILTGTNSCGKSSLNKSLLLIKENFNSKGYNLTSINELSFNNNLKLGGFNKIVNDITKDIVYLFPHRLPLFPEDEYIIKYTYSKIPNSAIDDCYLSEIKLINGCEDIFKISYKHYGKINYKINFTYFYFKTKKLESNEYQKFLKENSISENEKNEQENFILFDQYEALQKSSIGIIELCYNDFNLKNLNNNKIQNGTDCLNFIKYFKKDNSKLIFSSTTKLFNYSLLNLSINELELLKNRDKINDDKVSSFFNYSFENENKLIDKIIALKMQYPDEVIDEDSITKAELAILDDTTFFSEKDDWNDLNFSIFDEISSEKYPKYPTNIQIKDFFPKNYAEKFVFDLLFNKVTSNTYELGYYIFNFEFLRDSNYNKLFEQIIIEPIISSKHNICVANELNYLPVSRATQDRVYIYKNGDGNSINNIIIEFLKLNIQQDSYEFKFLNKWINEFNIAERIEILQDKEGLGSLVYLIIGSKKINLSDLGFGVAMFLPILLQIVCLSTKRYSKAIYNTFPKKHLFQSEYYNSTSLIIEEPEINLHPSLQSKLADMFIDATRTFNIQFIIETHSEYLIRRFQYLTAKKEIKPEDTIIHYLFHPESEHTKKTGEQLRTIRIQEDGRLDKEFGSGFFDEADNLALNLYSYNKTQLN